MTCVGSEPIAMAALPLSERLSPKTTIVAAAAGILAKATAAKGNAGKALPKNQCLILFLSRRLLIQANDTVRRDRRTAKARPANPSSIIAQVEGSGTADKAPNSPSCSRLRPAVK